MKLIEFGYSKSPVPWQFFLKATAYTVVLLLLQAVLISRLPYPALRADLLLPLMFGIAGDWSPLAGVLWASIWGYAVDTLSGKFWGFHVVSYVVAVCVVNIAIEKIEFHNPIYQMAFVGACALGQSFALGMFLMFEPSSSMGFAATWGSLLARSLLTMVLSPLIIYPISNAGRSY